MTGHDWSGDVRQKPMGYAAIADELRASIQSGDYPPGGLLPTHEALAYRYGVYLGTIRRTINQLHAEGLVDSTSGRGTVVRDRDPLRLPIDRYVQAKPGMGPWETACAAQGLVGRTEVTEVGWVAADRRIAQELEVEPGAQVIRRRNVMYANDVPRQLQETWVPRHIAEGTTLEKPGTHRSKTGGGIYGALATAGYHPKHAPEVVFSRMPTKREAELLCLPLGGGSPVADARRTTRDADGRVLVHTHVVVSGHVSLVYSQEL